MVPGISLYNDKQNRVPLNAAVGVSMAGPLRTSVKEAVVPYVNCCKYSLSWLLLTRVTVPGSVPVTLPHVIVGVAEQTGALVVGAGPSVPPVKFCTWAVAEMLPGPGLN